MCPADPSPAATEDDRRHDADQRLVEELARDNFEGPRYERFAEELCRYAVAVLRSWLHSGEIFRLCADKGITLRPTEDELTRLHTDPDARGDLALMTVAVALVRFRRNALIGGRWKADGGASLTTYFMGTCLYAFPNELRRDRARLRRSKPPDADDTHREAVTEDLAAGVTGDGSVRAYLARLPRPTRDCVALAYDGYSREEIAELVGLSVRAVEGLFYRLRTKERRALTDGGGPDE